MRLKNRKGQSFIGILVVLFVVIVVGSSLLPSIAETTNTATTTQGIENTASQPLLSMNTLFFTILILSIVTAITFYVLRSVGFL